jgi:PBP superfamily domain
MMLRSMLLFSLFEAYWGFLLNQTGGSFPKSVYLQTTFAYNFMEPSDSLTYFGPSSSVGVCNILGYWHKLNTDASGNLISTQRKSVDQSICTDKCTIDTCGYAQLKTGSITLDGVNYSNLPVRKDAASRVPLVDIGASDGLLSPSDYFNFPDLQLLPAIAGAVVPVYNIPELQQFDLTNPLVLSRSSLVNIFLGLITVRRISWIVEFLSANQRFASIFHYYIYSVPYLTLKSILQSWSHPSIMADNVANPLLQAALATVKDSISIVVRTDSSGDTRPSRFSCSLSSLVWVDKSL